MTPHPARAAKTALLAAALFGAGLVPLRADPAPAVPAPRPAAAKPQPGGKPTVLVVGDRFATALANGLEADAGIAVSRTTGDAFGLTRPSFADSLPTIRDRLARADRPALAAVMVGADDRDAVADGSGRFEPGTAGWARIYGDRVDQVSRLFRDAGVPVVWVGLPAARSAGVSADFVRQNGIIRDRAARDGVSYVDSFDGFTDAAGRYSPTGPDADGTVAKLRRADGLGFTRAGARKLASFLAPAVARLGRGAAAAGAADVANLTIERARGFDAALDVDVNAQIRREAAQSGVEAVRSQPSPPAALPQGPAAGPVLSLTAPPVAPDGQLASLALPADAPAGADPGAPRPGRADDFSWPKP